MNWAVVRKDNGLVVNTIVWDGVTNYTPPDGTWLVKIEYGVPAGIGWTYSEHQFTPPENPLPTRRP